MATDVVPASFHLLPAEVLLNIASFVPDLPSLYALDRASTHFALVSNEYGSQILEWVMCMTQSDRASPHQLHEVIRLVAHVRVMCLNKKPSQTLDAITGQLFERTSSPVVYNPIPLATPPSILRELLAVATTIAQLAPLCLATQNSPLPGSPSVPPSRQERAQAWRLLGSPARIPRPAGVHVYAAQRRAAVVAGDEAGAAGFVDGAAVPETLSRCCDRTHRVRQRGR